jgi:hypothetical protein
MRPNRALNNTVILLARWLRIAHGTTTELAVLEGLLVARGVVVAEGTLEASVTDAAATRGALLFAVPLLRVFGGVEYNGLASLVLAVRPRALLEGEDSGGGGSGV